MQVASGHDFVIHPATVQVQSDLSVQVLGDEVEATGEEGRGAFQPAPRVTEADHKKDSKSLHRALDKNSSCW